MSRPTLISKCRLCRAEGEKLFLKGSRCLSSKCPLEKKGAVPPGMHGIKRAKKPSDFAIQLRAKQKAKRLYGVLERQFKNNYISATSMKGDLGHNMLSLLERRLDNVIYVSGLCLSKTHAKQLISHGHFKLNGKKFTISSYRVKKNDLIEADTLIHSSEIINEKINSSDHMLPQWLELNKSKHSLKVISLPGGDDLKSNINQNLIIEYYSR